MKGLKDWEVLKALDEGKTLEVYVEDDINDWIVPIQNDRYDYFYEVYNGAIFRVKDD